MIHKYWHGHESVDDYLEARGWYQKTPQRAKINRPLPVWCDRQSCGYRKAAHWLKERALCEECFAELSADQAPRANTRPKDDNVPE